MLFTRELLSNRHRLSHQQIDVFLKDKRAKAHLAEKYEQMSQVREFIQLTDALSEAAISFIPLKGPILSYRLYKDACFRISHDLDFLIDVNAMKKAIDIVEKCGYQPDSFYWPDNLKQERALLKMDNHIVYFHPEKQLYIELHWKLFLHDITDAKVLNDVIKSNTNEIRLLERNFQVFNNELELLYLIIHGGLHAWFRLKWLLDVKDFIEKNSFDSEKFTQLVVKWNASRMVALCNAMLSTYFPETPLLPTQTVQGTKKRLKYCISQIENEKDHHASPLDKILFHWFRINCFPGTKYKLSRITGVLSRQGTRELFFKKNT